METASRAGRVFFWMFENTSHLDVHTRLEIQGIKGKYPEKGNIFLYIVLTFAPLQYSRTLGCEPTKTMLFNLRPNEESSTVLGHMPQLHELGMEPPLSGTANLSDLLTRHRHANVKVLPTLTTTNHSERTGNGIKHMGYTMLLLGISLPYIPVPSGGGDVHPVKEHGIGCALTVVEKERVLGFPDQFTDTGDLSPAQRKRLLGKAWCVNTVTNIFKFLLTCSCWERMRWYFRHHSITNELWQVISTELMQKT